MSSVRRTATLLPTFAVCVLVVAGVTPTPGVARTESLGAAPLVGRQSTRHSSGCNATSLFAALDAKTGTVIGKLLRRHLSFEKFLKCMGAETPDELDIQLILDNYGMHKSPRIRRAGAAPEAPSAFHPDLSPGLNLVGRWRS